MTTVTILGKVLAPLKKAFASLEAEKARWPYNERPAPPAPPMPTLPAFAPPPPIPDVRRTNDHPDVIAAMRRFNELAAARGACEAALEKLHRGLSEPFDALTAGKAILDGTPARPVFSRADLQPAQQRLAALTAAADLQRKACNAAVEKANLEICKELEPQYLAAARELVLALVPVVEAREKLVALLIAVERTAAHAGPWFKPQFGTLGMIGPLQRDNVKDLLVSYLIQGCDLLGADLVEQQPAKQVPEKVPEPVSGGARGAVGNVVEDFQRQDPASND